MVGKFNPRGMHGIVVVVRFNGDIWLDVMNSEDGEFFLMNEKDGDFWFKQLCPICICYTFDAATCKVLCIFGTP